MKQQKMKSLLVIALALIVIICLVLYNYIKSPEQQLGYEYISLDNILLEYYSHVDTSNNLVYFKDDKNINKVGYMDGGQIPEYLIDGEIEGDEKENYLKMLIYGNKNEDQYTFNFLNEYDSFDSPEREVKVRGMKVLLKTINIEDNFEIIGYFESEKAFYFLRFTNRGLQYSIEEFNDFVDSLIKKI